VLVVVSKLVLDAESRLASDFDGTHYIGLKFNQYLHVIEYSGYLVKVDVAEKQFADEAARKQAGGAHAGNGTTSLMPPGAGGYADPLTGNAGNAHTVKDPTSTTPETPKNTRFSMSAELDTTRIGRDVQKLVEEVISYLTSVDGAQVEVSLEVNATSPDGFSQQDVRTISENCKTLHVKDFWFDE